MRVILFKFGIVMRMKNKLYGGIEAGGTKFVCCISDGLGKLIAQEVIPTTNVDDTLKKVISFFSKNPPIISLGIGSFGPLDLDLSSNKYGYITSTPKNGWENTNIKGLLEDSIGIPVVIDYDVNCAALGEILLRDDDKLDNFLYLTIGTGIGGSLVLNGKPHKGESFIEMGHIKIPHEQFEGNFTGVCPYHKDCLEGIASGTAMEKRWGQRASDITDQKAWDYEAIYLGEAISNLFLIASPKLFILGGGVMNHDGLIEAVRDRVKENINNYERLPDLSSYVVGSSGSNNGTLGAAKLARTVS